MPKQGLLEHGYICTWVYKDVLDWHKICSAERPPSLLPWAQLTVRLGLSVALCHCHWTMGGRQAELSTSCRGDALVKRTHLHRRVNLNVVHPAGTQQN